MSREYEQGYLEWRQGTRCWAVSYFDNDDQEAHVEFYIYAKTKQAAEYEFKKYYMSNNEKGYKILDIYEMPDTSCGLKGIF